jgi:mono/diheme cytochrome c family protein
VKILRGKRLLGLVLLPLLALTLFSATLATAYAQTPDPARGRTVYSQNCQGCHGDQGQGVRGPAIAGYSKGEATLINKVRGNPRGNMPVFTMAQVSDADAASIHAYVRTLGASTTGGQGGGTQAPAPTTLPAAGTGGLAVDNGFSWLWLIVPLGLMAGASGYGVLRYASKRK